MIIGGAVIRNAEKRDAFNSRNSDSPILYARLKIIFSGKTHWQWDPVADKPERRVSGCPDGNRDSR